MAVFPIVWVSVYSSGLLCHFYIMLITVVVYKDFIAKKN